MSPKKLRARLVDRRALLQGLGAGVLWSTTGCLPEDPEPDPPATPAPLGPDSLPPITANEDFYVTSYFGMVDVDPAAWSLTLRRRGEDVGTIGYDELSTLAGTTFEHSLVCVESRPDRQRLDNARWSGLPLGEALAAFGLSLDPEALWFRVDCADGYSVGFERADLDRPLYLVWRMNDQVLPVDHGFPARLLAPGLYGWLNPKQIVAIDQIDAPFEVPWMPFIQHYLEESGLSTASDPAAREIGPQALVVLPTQAHFVEAGRGVRVLGKAMGGRDPVVVVECSVDDGVSWSPAEITYAPGPDRWTLWRFVFTPPAPGTYALLTRATTASGVTVGPEGDPRTIPFRGAMVLLLDVA